MARKLVPRGIGRQDPPSATVGAPSIPIERDGPYPPAGDYTSRRRQGRFAVVSCPGGRVGEAASSAASRTEQSGLGAGAHSRRRARRCGRSVDAERVAARLSLRSAK